jgi:hypothetical protein
MNAQDLFDTVICAMRYQNEPCLEQGTPVIQHRALRCPIGCIMFANEIDVHHFFVGRHDSCLDDVANCSGRLRGIVDNHRHLIAALREVHDERMTRDGYYSGFVQDGFFQVAIRYGLDFHSVYVS